MKIAMRKSGVFDPTFFSCPNTVLFDGDVKSKMVCFALRNWALILWSLSLSSEVAEQ